MVKDAIRTDTGCMSGTDLGGASISPGLLVCRRDGTTTIMTAT